MNLRTFLKVTGHFQSPLAIIIAATLKQVVREDGEVPFSFVRSHHHHSSTTTAVGAASWVHPSFGGGFAGEAEVARDATLEAGQINDD